MKEHGVLAYPGVERGTGVAGESDLSAGTLFSAGLIAGGSICGILYAVLYGFGRLGPFNAVGNALPWFHVETAVAQMATGLLFFALALVTARMGKRSVM